MNERKQMPDVFIQLCSWFHQDVGLLYPSVEKAIAGFVGQLDEPTKRVLSVYIGDLLSSSLSNQQLDKLWEQCGAEIDFSNRSTRTFLREVQEALYPKEPH